MFGSKSKENSYPLTKSNFKYQKKEMVFLSLKRRLSVFLCIIILLTAFTPGCSFKKQKQDSNQTDNVQGTMTNGRYGKPLFSYDASQNEADVPFIPLEYEAKVSPYKVSDNLSNVINSNQFGEFTNEQKKLLIQNGFLVVPTKEEQLFYIYENNDYKKAPSFITTDSVLQVYHVFFDYSLRTLESEKLFGILKKLTDNMLSKSIYIYNNLVDENIKSIALKNISYFYAAQVLLENPIPIDIPKEAKDLGDKEMELILGEGGFTESKIFPYELDYSQFKPRGHYTRNKDFEKYFKAMMWYGTAPFPLYKDNNGNKERNIEQTMQALLITYSLYLDNKGEQDIDLWERIYNPTVFYVGKTDDLSIYHYKELLVKVYGENPDLNKLNSPDKIEKLYSEAEKLPEPKIAAKYTKVTTPVGKQFRLMGQRYIPDSEIIQELVEPITWPIPSGLDVMGVLGSNRAFDIRTKMYNIKGKWPKYFEIFNKLKDKFSKLSDEIWRSNMYYGWLWVLKSFTNTFGKGYPSFMTNSAWEDKSISTALGSWAELRHDTILYGKQSGAECGGGEEPPKIKGYVEPNIQAYERLLWLTRYSRENLTKKDILTVDLKNKMVTFEDLLEFLIDCSIKELKNEELTETEYNEIMTYGGMLEYLTSSFADESTKWFEITSETDKNMAVIADVHTIAPNEYSPGGYLEVGVGPAAEIYVVVPIGGKLYLTRGAVFSYYEFESTTRLTDEEWQKSFKENNEPLQPEWTKSFIKGNKNSPPAPKGQYSSGC